MLPAINPAIDKMITDNEGNLSTYPFPDNVAAAMPKSIRQKLMTWMLQKYIWPQIQERQPFEAQWDKLANMSRAAMKLTSNSTTVNTRLERSLNERKQRQTSKGGPSGVEDEGESSVQKMEIADTLIFDAVDRLTNLNHFIAFKEKFPVRYEQPEDMVFPNENSVYSPMDSMIKSANCWLGFNIEHQDIYRKYWLTARHHYTYGVSFVNSEFTQRIVPGIRRNPQYDRRQPKSDRNSPFIEAQELQDIGVTFEPVSIRKLWLNWRIPIYQMQHQACPFFFDLVPRFAIVAKPYDAETTPFGFQNLQSLPQSQYLFGGQEMMSYFNGLKEKNGGGDAWNNVLAPENNVEALWTLYPMLPIQLIDNPEFDPNVPQDPTNPILPQILDIDEDGSKGYPMERYIMQMFGNNLTMGSVEIVRLQRNFYPGDQLPLYGSAHIPTLDDGAYPDAVGTILENHYFQICKSLLQYFENKEWINDPATGVMVGSPAQDQDINGKGSKFSMNSPQDIWQRGMYDATGTTQSLMAYVRDQAQTSSKTVDAILGKAMGARTSATEASNIFQTAMSGVTTDINLFCKDIGGGYADRLWNYSGRWIDPDIFKAITGSYGFAIKPEHFALRIGISWDSGSKFMESITRQNNLKFILSAFPPGDPSCNRSELLRELLREQRFRNIDAIVTDNGMYDNIQMANDQAQRTYLGQFVMVDPEQDHAIAIKVKKSYLADHDSVWNTTGAYLVNGPALVKQIEIHIKWQQYQFQMQQLAMAQQAGLADMEGNDLQSLQNQQPTTGSTATTPGQQRQQTGQ